MSSIKEKFKLSIGRPNKWTANNIQHSSFTSAKVDLRKEFLKKLGINNPKILDVYAGPGTMWKKAYNKSKNYLGLDLEFFNDERRMVYGNNADYLRCSKELDTFDVFDLDAFGVPFECLAIICNRLQWTKKNKVIVFLTDGTGGRNAGFNRISDKLLAFVGMKRHNKTRVQFDNVDNILATALIKCQTLAHAAIKDLIIIRAKNKGVSIKYIGFILEKY